MTIRSPAAFATVALVMLAGGAIAQLLGVLPDGRCLIRLPHGDVVYHRDLVLPMNSRAHEILAEWSA